MDPERRRYARQLRLPEVGEDGQQRLRESSALVIGTGGLGSPALQHLVGSGVGRVGVAEFDTVDVSNLHRQTLFATPSVGRPKLAEALDRLSNVNPEVELVPHDGRLDASNAEAWVGSYDVVVDGSDTFATRYLVNDASVATGTPNVYASVTQFSGQASVFGAASGPCYRCLFPEPPPAGLIPNCEDGGVLGVVPSLLGVVQASEALKVLLGVGSPLVGRLLMVDVLAMEFREIGVPRDPQCPACGPDRQRAPVATSVPEITVHELRSRLASADAPGLLDVREPSEHDAYDVGGRLVPLGVLEDEVESIRAEGRDWVVYCKSGGRSGRAVALLRERGIEAVSLRGGLDAWAASPVP